MNSLYSSPYKIFIFEGYAFDQARAEATFRYSFDGERQFEEKVTFSHGEGEYNEQALQAALQLSFLLVGTSYYKAFPTLGVQFNTGSLDTWQAEFANRVYRDGLSQFLHENNLTPNILPVFEGGASIPQPTSYKGQGYLAMQSGGKDSLLTAALLDKANITYTPWYMLYGENHPAVLDTFAVPLRTIKRQLDIAALKQAQADGGLNGHVPVTYIVMSFALIDMILHGEQTLLVSIGAEGAEAHGYIGELAVNHQWAKSWQAEKLLAEYAERYISPDIKVGSPLRAYTELYIAELFAENAWQRFGHEFSSCNLANYMQGSDNRKLRWDGTCPKCASTFLLFAPFIEPAELIRTIGANVLANPEIRDTYKGLLGIEGHMKPFECVAEVAELRLAYHMARKKWGNQAYQLPFEVPDSPFDYRQTHDAQDWAKNIINIIQN